MKNETILRLRAQIRNKVPQDYIQLKPDVSQHIYFAPATGTEFISTTTKNHVISNPIFNNWRMNRMADYLFDHKDEINKENFDEYLQKAKDYPEEIFKKAGEFGTLVHGYADRYFKDWILYNKQPDSILRYVDGSRGKKEEDYKAWACLRSLEGWINKVGYIPLASEIMVWNEKYHMAGTMDNVGVIGNQVGLPDWKSSNDFRDDYWIQLGNYYGMFYRLTYIRCEWGKIIKFDKDHGTPAKEDPIDHLPTRFKTSLLVSNLYDELQEIRKLRKATLAEKKVRI